MTGAHPDLLILLGDNVYGHTERAQDPRLPELRAAYAHFAANDGFRRVRSQVPILATWDDHDYGVNDGGADFPFRAESEALFREFWNISADDPRAHREGLYHAVTFGASPRRIQIVLLDTRSFRSSLRRATGPVPPDYKPYVPSSDTSLTMLGDEQWTWLEQTLQEPAEVRLVASSIQVLPTDPRGEHWGNFPHERERLLALLRTTQARALLLLSGDRHMGGMFHEGALWEVTSSSFNSPATIAAPDPTPPQVGRYYAQENFGLAEIRWSQGEILLELRDVQGETVQRATLPFRPD